MPSVAEFLMERMENANVNHVFTVPGDYILKFCKLLSDSDKIELVNNTDENQSGFAADAYARVNGIGAVCVTYNVGALKIANAVAGAYAERSPLIVISGSPGIKERSEGALLHHMVRSFECQKEIFDNITCASTVLDNPNRAGYEIDRVFEALMHHKQPIYIELPRDVASMPISYDVYKQGTPSSPPSDEENLKEALEEALEWIKTAKNPTILAGVQVARYGLGEQLIKFAEKANIPIATTLLSKSVISETHPLSLGVYAGSASHEEVREAVEESDCLLMLGVLLTDMTLSFMPSKFNKRNVINCSVERMRIKNHTFEDVGFNDFCTKIFKEEITSKPLTWCKSAELLEEYEPKKDTLISAPRFFEKINSILTKDLAIIADVGDPLFGAMDLTVHHSNQFLAPAFYTSMGFAIPGCLGVQMAKPELRPLVLVGDGSFQMSCTELSTIVNRGLNPIVFVLNNKGYSTERLLMDGKFNNIRNWNYDQITVMLGGGTGVCVKTEEELEEAVDAAFKSKELFIINICVEKDDVSPGLRRLIKGLASKV